LTDLILEQLRTKLSEEFRDIAPEVFARNTIHRVMISVNQFDILSWLNSVLIFPKFYWADRSGNFDAAAIGSLYQIQSNEWDGFNPLFNQIENVLENARPDLRFYGGVRFDPLSPIRPEWKSFGTYLFFVPLIEIINRDNSSEISFNFIPAEGIEKPFEILDQLAATETSRVSDVVMGKDLSYNERNDVPEEHEWQEIIGNALKLIEKEVLGKIVLARRTELCFDQSINGYSLFKLLLKNYSNSFCFYFQLNFNLSFMGITPELLYCREESNLKGEAIAGTRPRSTDLLEDKQLGRELKRSQKDVREHGWVLKEVENNFDKICGNWEKISSDRITRQAYVQHLYSQFSGTLKSNVKDSQILDIFHPTPAVAGFPRTTSIRYIDELEKFDRGWYAGPIGWISRRKTTFAVALRSSLVQEDQAFLYAGAGIVKGSDADKEWLEIENKMQNYLQIFKGI
jgi:menaquinone-specific isochorismate synthase